MGASGTQTTLPPPTTTTKAHIVQENLRYERTQRNARQRSRTGRGTPLTHCTRPRSTHTLLDRFVMARTPFSLGTSLTPDTGKTHPCPCPCPCLPLPLPPSPPLAPPWRAPPLAPPPPTLPLFFVGEPAWVQEVPTLRGQKGLGFGGRIADPAEPPPSPSPPPLRKASFAVIRRYCRPVRCRSDAVLFHWDEE